MPTSWTDPTAGDYAANKAVKSSLIPPLLARDRVMCQAPFSMHSVDALSVGTTYGKTTSVTPSYGDCFPILNVGPEGKWYPRIPLHPAVSGLTFCCYLMARMSTGGITAAVGLYYDTTYSNEVTVSGTTWTLYGPLKIVAPVCKSEGIDLQTFNVRGKCSATGAVWVSFNRDPLCWFED